jgi:hypothetical protein
MDKKKVIELIQSVINENTDNISFGDDRHNEHLRTANAVLRCVLLELRKSDWVSVEDELPPYNENVEVCSKVKPTEVWIDSRDKYINVGNSFRYNKLYGNIITHWKPIEKLEE